MKLTEDKLRKIIQEELKGHAKKMKEDGVSDEEIKKMHPEVSDEDLKEGKKLNEKAIKGKDAGNYIKMAPKGRKLHILGTKDGSDQRDFISLGKGKWEEKRTGEKLSWVEVSAIASALGDTKVFYEGKLNENFKKNIIKAKTMKDIKKIYPKAVKPRAIHGAVFYVELEKDLWAKCFSTNSMKSIEPFNIEAIYKMKGKKQTFLWREGKLTEAGMYKDVSDKFKDALDKLPQKLFTSKNVAKLAKKMKEKKPDAAMAYAKDAFGWLMKENKLRFELRKTIVKEMNTIFNSLP